MSVDDTEAFKAIFRGPYRTLEEFQAQLSRFQASTATSFYKYDVVTAAAYKRKTGNDVAEGFAYKWVQYRCVHCNRKGKGGSR